MTEDDLRRIAASVGVRRGWDFSRTREAEEPAPWDDAQIVRAYLAPDSHVLDVGTGGGERFLALANPFRSGVGIDASAEMIATAQENLASALSDKISFAVMPTQYLALAPASFDVVLNRHAPVDAVEVVRVLRPGGVFITQQVGAHNTTNICAIFGCTSGGTHASDPTQTPEALRAAFIDAGCRIVAGGEYDARVVSRCRVAAVLATGGSLAGRLLYRTSLAAGRRHHKRIQHKTWDRDQQASHLARRAQGLNEQNAPKVESACHGWSMSLPSLRKSVSST